MAAGSFPLAERAARELVRHAPRSANSYLALGEVLHQRRQLEEALWAYQSAARLSATNGMARCRSGQVRDGLGQHTAALEGMRTALRLDPGLSRWAPYYQELARVLLALGRTADAVVEYRRVMELLPDWADGWGNLGMYHHELGRYRQAVAAYERALRVDPWFFETRPDQRERWRESLRELI